MARSYQRSHNTPPRKRLSHGSGLDLHHHSRHRQATYAKESASRKTICILQSPNMNVVGHGVKGINVGDVVVESDNISQRELESEEIVHRTVTPDIPVRIEYLLTDKGADLHDAVAALNKWADRWDS